ncbi:MAG: DUF2007 domain-containing protein [Myxococcales bacterium]|nr:DUF2007 domain-containing protein [Myxococcales bacterium]
MKYCTRCRSEYQDSATACSDCGGEELIAPEEMKRRGLLLPHEVDTRRLVRVATAEDPYTAEQLSAVLEAAEISTLARARRAMESPPWWEILVPEEQAEKAKGLVSEEKARLEANVDEAARAAEEEEASGETSGSTQED